LNEKSKNTFKESNDPVIFLLFYPKK